MESEFDIGFNMEDEETFFTLPEMQYVARCDKVERRDSKDGEFKNVWWNFTIVEGDFKNRSPREYCTTLKPGIPHIGFLRTCAALRPDLEQKGSAFKPSDYVGHTCILDIKHEDYQDRPYAKIMDALPAGSGGAKKAAPVREEKAEEVSFDQQPPTDDDVPF